MQNISAIYTIADPSLIEKAMRSGRRGILHEGRAWRKAADWLQQGHAQLPLLLGNAASIEGIEWVAVIEKVEISDGKTVCRFTNLKKLSRPIPLRKLAKASDGSPLSDSYIRPYVPCLLDKRVGNKVQEALESAPAEDERPISKTANGNALSKQAQNTKHYVQYHNSDRQGGRPPNEGNGYQVYSSKPLNNLKDQRLWLISGEGKGTKTFFLEYTFFVDEIRKGSPNLAVGSRGITFDPPICLSRRPWFEKFKRDQQNFSLGIRAIDSVTVANLERLVEQNAPAEDRAWFQVGQLTAEDFTAALELIEEQLADSQIEMLIGHASARNQTISMEQLGFLAGYSGFQAANIQYGKIGTLMANAFGISGLSQKTQMLATGSSDRDKAGHWQWVMRPPLVAAIRKHWGTRVLQTSVEMSTAADLEEDPSFSNLRATDRTALVQSRIGQGEYRRKLIKIWNGRCAVTGCDLESVLVASHAKPWSSSTNRERLDGFNGLLLTASIDKLFDQGLIAFEDDGRILVRQEISDLQLEQLGLSRQSRLSQVQEKHRPYLRAHRISLFVGESGDSKIGER